MAITSRSKPKTTNSASSSSRCRSASSNWNAKRCRWLFTFLDYAGVEATNNRAERALRPDVIARKLSCGNKTERGKRTWEILASLAATCHQRDEDLVEHLRPYLLPPPSAKLKAR